MTKISREVSALASNSALTAENEDLKAEKQSLIDAAEKAKKDVEWHKGAAASAEKARAEAIAEKDKAEELLRQKEANFNEARTILNNRCAEYEEQIRQHNKKMEAERLKITDALNQRDEARRDLEKAENAKKNIAEKAAKAIIEFKSSEEGVAWVQEELSKNLVESTAEIMSFVDSQVPGVDWTQNPMCNMLLALRQPAAEADPAAEDIADGDGEVAADPAVPSGGDPQEGP